MHTILIEFSAAYSFIFGTCDACVTMILALEAFACLMISAEVKNGFAMVETAPRYDAPKNEYTNSGEFGSSIMMTSPLLMPCW
ncbi:hypothetical protein HanIR_Chr09g0445511 [Helianthus annuus]|nr:hypothetical protein HanIR_Chr09g0445511 [Helianthus annuus]